MIDLHGRTALVTGASRGIGRACAVRLAEAGADVIVNYLSSHEDAEQVTHEIRRLGRRSALVRADVSEPEDVASMIGFIGERFERLDILVSNAAAGGFRTLLDSAPLHFDLAMHANSRATLILAQTALPLMRRREGRSKIVALSSHGSHRAIPQYGLIGASKAALESIIRQLAFEIGSEGVNCNVVLAGLVPTDSTRQIPEADAAFKEERLKRMVGSRDLLPSDVADVVLFLASPLSDLVQGQTIVVDGGGGLRV